MPNYFLISGSVESMNRTLNEATEKRYF